MKNKNKQYDKFEERYERTHFLSRLNEKELVYLRKRIIKGMNAIQDKKLDEKYKETGYDLLSIYLSESCEISIQLNTLNNFKLIRLRRKYKKGIKRSFL